MKEIGEKLRLDIPVVPEAFKDYVEAIKASIGEMEGETWGGTQLGNSQLMLGKSGVWAVNRSDKAHVEISLTPYTPPEEYENEPTLPEGRKKYKRPIPLLNVAVRRIQDDLLQIKISYQDETTNLGERLLTKMASKLSPIGDEIDAFLGDDVYFPKQEGVYREWRARWMAIKRQVELGKSNLQIIMWLTQQHPQLACGETTLRKNIKAGTHGKLDTLKPPD